MDEHRDYDTGSEMPPPPASTPEIYTQPGSASGLAIAAFVLGIVSFVMCGPCTGLPALIIGMLELGKIRDGLSPAQGKPFATVGAILGGANFALALLAGIIYAAILFFAFLAQGGID